MFWMSMTFQVNIISCYYLRLPNIVYIFIFWLIGGKRKQKTRNNKNQAKKTEKNLNWNPEKKRISHRLQQSIYKQHTDTPHIKPSSSIPYIQWRFLYFSFPFTYLFLPSHTNIMSSNFMTSRAIDYSTYVSFNMFYH